MVSKKIGVLLLSTSTDHQIEEKYEALEETFSHVDSMLVKSATLRTRNGKKGRKLVFEIDAQVLCEGYSGSQDVLNSLENLSDFIKEKNEELTDEHLNEIRSILEGAKALSKPSKRTAIVEDEKNKLNILIKLEDEIINFDAEQRKVAINLINGPQRIRGLAGSGKTIILAMKAAYIHLQYPNKKILFTFYTKSLYVLIKEVIGKFYRHFASSDPDWSNIDILHAWGGYKVDGVYFNSAIENDTLPISLDKAKSFNNYDPFKYVCSQIINNDIKQKYDYILIDEAQDLPDEFFRLCYKLLKGNTAAEKNIVWAYDDLQTIFNIYTRTPKELFGTDTQGKALIDLNLLARNLSWGQKNDLVLHKCYRNPLPILVTAHALGFGLYDKPVQILENLDHWKDVGYELESGTYQEGNDVVLSRNPENSPLSINEYQTKSDLLKTFVAENINQEVEFIKTEIEYFLSEGLKPEDIMVISLDDRNAKNYFRNLSSKLSDIGILTNNVLTTYSENPPFKIEKMVTLSTVHRAKGNEAACVLVLGIDAMYQAKDYRRTRNKIFTAFTRTKAWLRVSGIGQHARHFENEINISLENSPKLMFKVPNKRELEHLQRDLGSKAMQLQLFRDEFKKLQDVGMTNQEIEEEMQRLMGGSDDGY
nr:ATP-binding domain-containing protein [Acinetobacter sp. YH12072]